MKRALVAVGVDKTASPQFRPLSAAAAGAKGVAAWGGTQGFDVTLLSDESGPVTVSMFFDAVRKFVDANVYSQLVVYFSGHGVLLSPDAEVWLLSGALTSPNEAVNVSASIVAARTSGIPHVVIISDACRSMPTSFLMGAMSPGKVFPTKQPRAPGPEVDVFYATLPGDPALELPPDEAEKRYRGLLTSCLLAALKGSPASLIQNVQDGTGIKHVVASRPLKSHLIQAVPAAAAAVSIQLAQDPDVRVESALPKYLSEVSVAPLTLPPAQPGTDIIRAPTRDSAPEGLKVQSVSQVLASSWKRWAVTRTFLNVREKLNVPDVADAKASVRRIVDAESRRSFETRTGFTFNGLDVRYVRSTGTNRDPELFVENGALHARVHTDDYRQQVKRAALIRFASGAGAVLSILPGYVGAVVAEKDRVLTVNYTPAQGTDAHVDYAFAANEIAQSRALVATLARHGSFRLDTEAAAATALLLRRNKRLDPTLGLFASYAYAQSGHSDEVLSVYQHMVEDGLPVLFDVAMLAAQVAPTAALEHLQPPRSLDFAPWLPLLTQGWLLLGRFEEAMPAVLREAKRYLTPGLWTTFAPEGLDILEVALFGGKKQ